MSLVAGTLQRAGIEPSFHHDVALMELCRHAQIAGGRNSLFVTVLSFSSDLASHLLVFGLFWKK